MDWNLRGMKSYQIKPFNANNISYALQGRYVAKWRLFQRSTTIPFHTSFSVRGATVSAFPRPLRQQKMSGKVNEAWFLLLKFYLLPSGYCESNVSSFWSIGPFLGAAVTAPFSNDDRSKRQPQSVQSGADNWSPCCSEMGYQAIKNTKTRKTF